MINHRQILLALRAQAVAMIAAAADTDPIAATSTGYSRMTGSFVDDGFAMGMEMNASGFIIPANNGLKTIAAVNDLTITCDGTGAEAADVGTLVVGFPALRAWENTKFDPPISRWYIEEDYMGGPARQITVGERGEIEGLPMYVVKVYCPSTIGSDAPFIVADGLLESFAPRRELPLSNGDVVRVRTDVAPYRGQVQAAGPGRAVVVVTIPLRIRSLNII